MRTLKVSTEKNTIRKEMMLLSLLENIANAKIIRDRIPIKIKFQDKRNYLELVIKNHVLELQNIEMEIHLQIQDKTIADLKNIIDSQRKIITDTTTTTVSAHSNNLLLNDDPLNNISSDDIELELQDLIDEHELTDEKDIQLQQDDDDDNDDDDDDDENENDGNDDDHENDYDNYNNDQEDSN